MKREDLDIVAIQIVTLSEAGARETSKRLDAERAAALLPRIRIIQKGEWLPLGVIRVPVGRPNVLGNPWSHKAGTRAAHRVADRATAVARFAEWIDGQPRNSPQWCELGRLGARVAAGETIALECFCGTEPRPGTCHATVIRARVAELAVVAEHMMNAGIKLWWPES